MPIKHIKLTVIPGQLNLENPQISNPSINICTWKASNFVFVRNENLPLTYLLLAASQEARFLCGSNDGLARDEGKMSDYRSIVIGFYGRDYRFAAICTPQTSWLILALPRDGFNVQCYCDEQYVLSSSLD